MRKLFLTLILGLVLPALAFGAGTRKHTLVFDNDGIAGDGDTITSQAVYVGDWTGDFSVEGTLTSASPDHSITITVWKAFKVGGTTYTYATADATIATSVTADNVNEGYEPSEYTTHLVIKVANGAGKENCTPVLQLRGFEQ